MRTILAVLVVALLTAGCLTLPEDPQNAAAAAAQTGLGSMSANEQRVDKSGVCTGGLDLGGDEGFCATRTITIAGGVSGISALDVNLESFNGDVLAEGDVEGKWRVVVVLEGRGSSETEAKSRLESIEFSWAHERDGLHVLDVVARKDRDSEGRSADIHAQLPRSILLALTASTVNGNVAAEDVHTTGMSLRTTNGDATANADVAHADVSTTNGDVDVRLRPIGSGRISLDTTNGGISLALPEADAFGYKIEAETTNGDVEIHLRDGEVGPCPEGSQYYTPPCNSRTFESSRFSARPIQSYVDLDTTNGAITVSPS